MTDKKTSATKKASAATKQPVTPTSAPPKAEVNLFFFFHHSFIYFKPKQKADLTKKPAAATIPSTQAQAKPKATTPSTKSTSSLAKTSTKVTKKSTSTKGGAKKKFKAIKYHIDCTHPVEDGIFDLNAFVCIISHL